MYLLDTNILSDVHKRRAKPAVWLRSVAPTDAYLSVITIGEISRGIAKLRRQQGTATLRLEVWLAEIRRNYSARILPVTEDVAVVWGELSAGRTRSEADSLIAATAIAHRLIVVTRNVAVFADTGVTILNPWDL